MASTNSNVATRKRTQTAGDDHPSLKEQVEILREDVSRLAADAGVAAQHQLDPLTQYVAREPLKALLIASGIGCFLGFLFSRR